MVAQQQVQFMHHYHEAEDEHQQNQQDHQQLEFSDNPIVNNNDQDSTEKVKSRWTRSFFTALDRRHNEERYICDICHKDLASPSTLKLHRNTHVIERRYKCEPCQVSFHSQGHLQKHKRSSAHETRVEMTQAFGIPTSDNPRPYGCPECDIAFRKHGHLAKHLRSKSHITKLESNGLIPLGTYAMLERCSNMELKERLVTTNCEHSLRSLRSIAMTFFQNPALQMQQLPPASQSNFSPSSSGGGGGVCGNLSRGSSSPNQRQCPQTSGSGHRMSLTEPNPHMIQPPAPLSAPAQVFNMAPIAHHNQQSQMTFSSAPSQQQFCFNNGSQFSMPLLNLQAAAAAVAAVAPATAPPPPPPQPPTTTAQVITTTSLGHPIHGIQRPMTNNSIGSSSMFDYPLSTAFPSASTISDTSSNDYPSTHQGVLRPPRAHYLSQSHT